MRDQQSVHPDEKDELLTLLSDHIRRRALSSLRKSPDGVVSIVDLARDVRERTESDSDRVAVRLHHSTLPKLAAAGVVDYDERSETVRYHGDPDLERLLDRIHGP